jgi:hypothetical protein
MCHIIKNKSSGVNLRAQSGQKTDIFSHQEEKFSGSQNRRNTPLTTIKHLETTCITHIWQRNCIDESEIK